MSDTVRTYAVNQTQLATNGVRGISAQKIRDFLASVLGVVPETAFDSATATTYAPTESDGTVYINCTTAAVTVNLLAAATLRVGKRYTFIKTDTSVNAIIIDANSAETINGETTQILFTQYASITIENTGTAWLITDQRNVRTGHLFIQTASVNVNNDNTEKTLLTTGIGSLTLPANFYRVGTHLRCKASGFLGTTATPTQTFQFKHGSTVLTSSGALTLGSGVSNVGWELIIDITCVATGASNTLWVQGHVSIADGTNHFKGMVNTALLSVNTATSQVINLTETFSATGASNTITLTNFEVEKIA